MAGRKYHRRAQKLYSTKLGGKAAGSDGSVTIKIAEKSGVYLFEERKNGLIYGFTVTVGKSARYGKNAWYLPNWCKEFALALMPKLVNELSKPKKSRSFATIFQTHFKDWSEWLRKHSPNAKK